MLSREVKGVVIDVDDTCEFERARAYRSVLSYVEKLDSRQCLHAIFCTNDEWGWVPWTH